MKNLIYQLAATMFAVIALALLTADAAQAQTESDIREELPRREKQISEGGEGAEIALEVDFASFNGNAEALSHVPFQGLEETAYGVVRFCTNSDRTSERDAVKVGRLKSKVKKIVFRFVPKPSQKSISLQKGGVVLIEAAFGVSDGRFAQTEVQAALGKLL